jgi:uncharacterized protein YgiM (DUF1202 family)
MKMASTQSRSFVARRRLAYASALLVLLLAACQPIVAPGAAEGQTPADSTEIAAEDATDKAAEEAAEPAAETESAPAIAPAKATISTRSLRVRSTPTDNGDIIGGVRQGDSYPVVGISSDGAWVQLEIPDVDGGAGWVSASLVTLEGDITNITITDVAEFTEEPAAEETPAEEATAEETAAEEATAEEATEEEATAEETTEEEATAEESASTETEAEEATAEESSEAATAEEAAAEEASEEPAVEASTPVTATAESEESTTTEEDAPEEAAVAETAEITGTIAITDDAETSEEPATAEATPAAPSLGTVTINADPPLRVRSSPTTEEDNKVGNVYNGETYTVLEVSEDGLWVRIDVPQLGLENGGWVSAEFVVYN